MTRRFVENGSWKTGAARFSLNTHAWGGVSRHTSVSMSAATASVSAPPKKANVFVTVYLFLFNVFSAAAWAYTLFLAVSHLRASPAAGVRCMFV